MGMTADELKALQERADAANNNPDFDALLQARPANAWGLLCLLAVVQSIISSLAVGGV